MKSWNFSSREEMYNLLVGWEYGSDPESQIENIINDKKKLAEFIFNELSINVSGSHILEIGSGCGDITKHIAPHAGVYYCTDISESFLAEAKKNCETIFNIRYHHISSARFDFLADSSLDAAIANNVFVHFNLFDIYLYFSELSRVLKSGGVVWFDIASCETFDSHIPKLFSDMAAGFKHDPEQIKCLVQWNHPATVISIAKHFGFEWIDRKGRVKSSRKYIFYEILDKLFLLGQVFKSLVIRSPSNSIRYPMPSFVESNKNSVKYDEISLRTLFFDWDFKKKWSFFQFRKN